MKLLSWLRSTSQLDLSPLQDSYLRVAFTLRSTLSPTVLAPVITQGGLWDLGRNSRAPCRESQKLQIWHITSEISLGESGGFVLREIDDLCLVDPSQRKQVELVISRHINMRMDNSGVTTSKRHGR